MQAISPQQQSTSPVPATINQPSTRNLLANSVAATSTIARNKLVNTSSLNATAGGPPVSLTLPTVKMAVNATYGSVSSKPEVNLGKTNRSQLGKRRKLEVSSVSSYHG